MGQVGFNPFCGTNKVETIKIVLLHTRGNSEHIGVEYNVVRINTHLFGEQFISTLTYFYFASIGCSLSFFVESHNYHSCAILMDGTGMVKKECFAFFQRDGVDHTFALHTL